MTTVTADPRTLDRIRWRARRGLLENDLILKPFLDTELEKLDSTELVQFDKLLQMGDNELLDLLMGRESAQDSATAALISKILAVRH